MEITENTIWNKCNTSNILEHISMDAIMCLKQFYYLTFQDTFRRVLHDINPRNVIMRTANVLRHRNYFAPGPNYIWHVDGYDKLKAYGFTISGC